MRRKANIYLATEKKLLASFHKLTNTLKGKEIKKDSGENLDELYLAVLASQYGHGVTGPTPVPAPWKKMLESARKEGNR